MYKSVSAIYWIVTREYWQNASVRFRFFPHSNVYDRFGTRVTWRVRQVEEELLNLPNDLNSRQLLSGVRVTRSLVFCVVFCRSLFVLFSSFLWSLYCLFLFDLRILLTPLLIVLNITKIVPIISINFSNRISSLITHYVLLFTLFPRKNTIENC